MADVYDYWRHEIDLPGSQRRDTEESIVGWWRVKGAKTKWDKPAVIWKDTNGKTWLKIGRMEPVLKDSDTWFGWTQWQFVKADAVMLTDYEYAMEHGHWPDGKPTHAPKKPQADDRPTSGDLVHDPENDGPLIETLADEIESLAEAIESFPGVKDQKSADRMGELHRRMQQLWKRADEERAKEKQPSLDESRRIDNEWRPLLATAEQWGKHASATVKAYLKAEEARLREAERQRREEERAKQPAPDTSTDVPEREAPLPVAKASGGSAGKAVSLTTRRKGVIDNETKFINSIKKRRDFQEFIQKIADGLARANQPVNGLKIEEVRE